MTPSTIPDPVMSAFEREKAAVGGLREFLAEDERPTIPAGYYLDTKGRLVPEKLVAEEARLEDDVVHVIAGFALDLHRQLQRFRGHAYEDLAVLDELLCEKYGAKPRGGVKGNRTYTSIDGCKRITVQVQDRIAFGPQLQVARQLFDECIAEWTEGSRDEIRALIQHAFEPNVEGKVSLDAVISLRRIEIDDERWRSAQKAISDAIQVVGSASYIRVHVRARSDSDWIAVPIDLAKLPLPEQIGK